MGPMIPLLLFAGFGLFILIQEVPAVGDRVDQLFRPEVWQARQVCRKAALAAARQPEFARLLERGDVHRTGEGSLVDGLVLGEMGTDGREQRIEYNCYLDGEGALVKIGRTIAAAPRPSTDKPGGPFVNEHD